MAVLLLTACGESTPLSGRILQYELTLALSPDGSLDVVEHALVEGAAARLRITIAPARVDAVEDLEVTVDGQRVEHGREADEPGGALVVPLPAGPEAARVAISYRAVGAMAVRGARGVIVWPAVPGGEGMAGEVRIQLTWPDGNAPMVGPAVEAGNWDVVVSPTGARLTGRNVQRDPVPRVYVDLALADPSVAEPVWQVNELRARQLLPAFVSAGLFMAVVGAGILTMMRLQYPNPVSVGGTGAARLALDLPEEGISTLQRRRPWQADAAALKRLIAAGLVDPDRLAAARGLRVAAVVVGVAAAATAAMIPLLIGHLGPWPHAVPLGMLATALMLGLRGRSLPVLTPAGVEAGVLHSRRLQASPEP